jgi:tyrosyl-tRNA synthetase
MWMLKAYIRIFTLFERDVIEAIETEHDAAPHTRVLQKALAKDITIACMARQAYEKAIKSSEFLFGNTGIEFLSELNDERSISHI